MKKTTLILAALGVCAFAFTGCKNKKAKSSTNQAQASAKPTAAQNAPAAKPAAANNQAKPAAQPAAANDQAKPAAGGAAASTGIPACDKYLAAFQKYMSCSKIPAATKTQTKKSIAMMKKSWASLKGANVPAASKKAAAKGCTQGTAALQKSAKALGCSM